MPSALTIPVLRGMNGGVPFGLRHATNRVWQYTVPADAAYAILRRITLWTPIVTSAPINPVTPAVWLSQDGVTDALIDICYSSPTTERMIDDVLNVPLKPGTSVRGSYANWQTSGFSPASSMVYIEQIGGTAPGYLARDTFTGPNGTNLAGHLADSGQPWVIGAGTWTIQGNALQSAQSAGIQYATIGNGWADVDVRANVTLNKLIGASVMARFTDINNYYAAALSGAGTLILRTVIAGVDTENQIATGIGADGTSHELRLRCIGGYLTLWWDGVLKGVAVAGAILPAGAVGLWNANNATGSVNPFDSFVATAL